MPEHRNQHPTNEGRPDLDPGMVVPGPAIVAEDETSTFVTRQFSARVAANRYLVIERRGGRDSPSRADLAI